MRLKQLHSIVGRTFGIFFIVASLSAVPLFWRHDGLYSEATKEFIVSIHTWEAGAKYIGSIMALALLLMSCTGLILAFGEGRKKSNKALDVTGE